jgi:hypothetical protein
MALEDPIRMGGHFTSMFPEGEDLTWRLIPYILVWGAFGVIFVVSDVSGHPHPRVTAVCQNYVLRHRSPDMAIHHTLRPGAAETTALREDIHDRGRHGRRD